MQNETTRSKPSGPSNPTPSSASRTTLGPISSRPPSRAPGTKPTSRARSAPPSAFSAAFLQTFLARATRLEDMPSSAPSALARGGSSGAAVWAGPWEVERVDGPHGPQWAVARRGEPVAAGGRAGRCPAPGRRGAAGVVAPGPGGAEPPRAGGEGQGCFGPGPGGRVPRRRGAPHPRPGAHAAGGGDGFPPSRWYHLECRRGGSA
jgi:hypothetical protein